MIEEGIHDIGTERGWRNGWKETLMSKVTEERREVCVQGNAVRNVALLLQLCTRGGIFPT